MTAGTVRPRPRGIPLPEAASDSGTCPAVGYQRVLHQLARRELRMLAELAAWAPAGDAARTATITTHADLIGRVLLHHHEAERTSLWPALLRAVPATRVGEVRTALADWTTRCARIDAMLRDLATGARQWRVTCTAPARDSVAMACWALADAVDAQTAQEEQTLLPLLGTYLGADDWAGIARTSRCRLSGPDQLLVLGLALEDSSAADRARLLDGLSPATRAAWTLHGRRHYRAAVVRLRGAPPAR
jgi:hypothetical protein